MLPKIGIDAHWARDITLLAEDLAQITTFESKEQMLIKAMESISPSVKHLRDFEPCTGKSYEKYGPYTHESAKKAYFALMEKNTERLKKDSKQIPSLKRVAAFFTILKGLGLGHFWKMIFFIKQFVKKYFPIKLSC
jgi:hypothetical protein